MSALLEVEGLEARYGASQALFGINLNIGAGEMVTPVSYTHLTLPTIYSV